MQITRGRTGIGALAQSFLNGAGTRQGAFQDESRNLAQADYYQHQGRKSAVEAALLGDRLQARGGLEGAFRSVLPEGSDAAAWAALARAADTFKLPDVSQVTGDLQGQGFLRDGVGMAGTDPAGAAFRLAAGGRTPPPIYSQNAAGQVLDQFGGGTSQTGLSRSVIGENEATAGAQADLGGKYRAEAAAAGVKPVGGNVYNVASGQFVTPPASPWMTAGGNLYNTADPSASQFPPRAAGDVQLQEVYDPTSPTGTRLVARGDAVGQPGKPGSKGGFRVYTDENGNQVVEMGAPSGVGLQRRTVGTVEDNLLSAGDTLSQLTAIRAKFEPQFQAFGTRLGMMWSAGIEKLNPDALGPEEQRQLSDFTRYKAEAGQLFALTLKDLSGVAVNPQEFERAKAWLPTPGDGLLDGDSPTELRAKLDRFEEFTRSALMKYSYIRRHGLTVNDVDVEQMPTLMQQRGDALAAELGQQGLQGQALVQAVKQGLADEFGLTLY